MLTRQSFTIDRWFACLAAALAPMLGAEHPAGAQSQIIAVTGQSAPDGNGTLATFDAPVLNDLGQVAFRAALSGTTDGEDDDTAIYRGDGAALAQIAREHPKVFLGSRDCPIWACRR